jgi:Oligosaccharyl transferase STT3 subunit
MIRALLLVGAVSGLWAAVVAASGGFDLRVAGLPIRSHSATPAVIVSVLAFAAACFRGIAPVRDAIAWWWLTVESRAAMFACAVAIAAVATGVVFGTDVAGGPDSYCYLNQAEIFARGHVREHQPIVARAPFPDRAAPFVPIGHVPSPGPEGTIVPMCAAGYPLLMAAARTIGGRTAMFWVVPITGGLAVWLTFLLGRRVANSPTGLFAAILLATSPTFLYQIVQPMTDVPAVALWTLAVLVAIRQSAFLAGVMTGAALMVRPNLLPLAGVIALIVSLPRFADVDSIGRTRMALRFLAFGFGVLPFVVAVMAFQNAMYGGPLKSGYGDLGSLFAIDHVVPNLRAYTGWLLRTETPAIICALFGPLVVPAPKRRLAWWLLAFAAATFACYIPYEVFDAWWYLRFVLPAFPALFILLSATILAVLDRFSVPVRVVGGAAIVVILVCFHLSMAVAGSVFRLHDLERRFRDAGEYVAQHLPANAAVVTVWQSGSVRFYSGRLTMLWNSIDAGWLDRSLDFLRAEGYEPYLLFESNEEREFRQKFEGHSPLGGLDWPPVADINRQVRIYAPRDRERYMRGERIETERVRFRR